eukprot:CAMPEP_0118808218 /NCGR_PEP_ID=MMETSP1161-20130426/35873_1 /TAXON_ID=249345 /ORGANISM="Picochlorum oklahomensis, Strain CCMP2329" /LENGTH=59 /DNA_ID=CAMNT_0006737607 /DNA_START=677 /DNA_END=856 /DNA_ORIENTATION=+
MTCTSEPPRLAKETLSTLLTQPYAYDLDHDARIHSNIILEIILMNSMEHGLFSVDHITP